MAKLERRLREQRAKLGKRKLGGAVGFYTDEKGQVRPLTMGKVHRKPVLTPYKRTLAPAIQIETPKAINITNIQGVTIVGEDSTVNAEFGELCRSMNILAQAISRNDILTDQQKLSYQADINIIKSQLAKPNPDRNMLKRAWEGLKTIATVGSLLGVWERVRDLIIPLITIT